MAKNRRIVFLWNSKIFKEKINCWGAISAKGKAQIYIFEKNMNSEVYVDILTERLSDSKNWAMKK